MPLALVTLLFLTVSLHHVTGLRNSVAFAVALWTFGRLIRERALPPLAIPMVAWLLIGSASAAWSPSSIEALKAAFYDMVLPAGALYGAYLLSKRPFAYRVLSTAVIAGTFLLAAIVGVAYAVKPLGAELGGGLFRYYPGEGVSSTLSVYALPVALLLASAPGWGVRMVGCLGVVCVLIDGIASGNRMFWPSAVGAVAAFYAWQWRTLRTGQRIGAAALLALCAVSAVVMSLQLSAPFRNPLVIMTQDNRPAAWREWAKIAADAPLLGHGLGLKNIRATAKSKLPPEFIQRNPEMEFHAHSLFLDIVLQIGVVGLVVFVGLLVALVREAWRARDRLERRLVGASLIALIVAMLLKNATDDFMHHAVVVAFWGYAGILLGRLHAEGAADLSDAHVGSSTYRSRYGRERTSSAF